ncbi:MAG: imidazole glycerol phosphate synthase subunit HisH [Flavobacteriales bacterium]
MKIAIVKYGMGNVSSVQKALKKIGYESILTDDPEELKRASLILLPGVGSFKKGIENLKESGLKEVLINEVITNKKPFIGICLGMQLVATYGTEPEKTEGLGWIDGEIIKIESEKQLRVPHLGWNSVNVKSKHDFYKEFEEADFYFIHSYHFKPNNIEEVVMTTNYGIEIVAAMQKDNIHVMQFHPEKSQEVGMKLLEKIINKYA